MFKEKGEEMEDLNVQIINNLELKERVEKAIYDVSNELLELSLDVINSEEAINSFLPAFNGQKNIDELAISLVKMLYKNFGLFVLGIN